MDESKGVLQNLDAEILCEDTEAIDRLDWLRLRQQGVGGSDAAASIGFSPWVSPLALYFDKTDPVKDEPDQERWKRGRQMESVIADMWAEENKYSQVVKLPLMLRSNRWSWMMANPDRFTLGFGDTHPHVGILECKNVDRSKSYEWEDGPPLHYRLQGQHYLAVCGPAFTVVHFAALIGGNHLVTYEVHRDDNLIAQLVADEEAFWTLVTTRRPPAVDGSESTKKALAAHFSRPERETVEVGPRMLELITDRISAKLQMEIAKSRVDKIENEMKSMIGDATAATVDGDVVATWKPVHKDSYVVKEQNYRQIGVTRRGKKP